MPHARPRIAARSAAVRTLAAFLLAASAACSGGSGPPPPVPVASLVIAPGAAPLAVGQTQLLTATPRDAAGNSLSGRTITWSSDAVGVASVNPGGLVTAVATGNARITATSEGVTASVSATVFASPVLLDVTPATLVPGALATLTGTGFDGVRSNNTVTVQGMPATVVSGSTTQLVIIVPCLTAGTVGVRVTANGILSALVARPLQTTQRTLAVGQALIATDDASSFCNELVTASATARYLVAIFSGATSANTLTDFDFYGNPVPATPEPALVRATQSDRAVDVRVTDEQRRDAAHFAYLERERRLYQTLRGRARPLAERVSPPPAALVAVGDLRSAYFTYTGGCADSTKVIRARAVYVGTYAIVWEDTANALQAGVNPSLAGYYQRLGQIFDLDQYTTVKNGFGDPLRRDPVTDNDGKLHMIFTQRLNGSGAAAYVAYCDQVSRGAGTWGSNFGEFFYGTVPTIATLNVNSTASPDGWFAFMARTVVHEVKHIASVAARVANNAPAFEESWLEEGTARHAEELWVRGYLHKVAWKANTGFGTAATNGLFCDFALADATCDGNDALRRPGYGMRRHFNELLPKLQDPWNWSPYGDGTGQSGSVFYQTVWSLVRYTIDRYGASDNAFLTGLTNSTASGIANLAAQAGVPMDQLLGGWGLALYADDYPGLAAPSADITFPTWNLRDIYASLNAQPAWVGRFPTPFPIAPVPLAFGTFALRATGLRGGAHAYFEFSGTAGATQLLNLRSTVAGEPMPTTLRIAIARLQ